MKIILSVLALLVFGQFASAGVSFDQGVDVKSVIKEVEASEVKAPEARYGLPVYSSRDCKKITFTETSPLASPRVELETQDEYQDCQNIGYPVGQICTPRWERHYASAQIVITEPRVLRPGQTETFEVCLWGQFLSMKPLTPAYKYSVNRILDVFNLTPQIAPAAKGAPQDVCSLVLDGNTCVYRCKDGSYISKPNPFPAIPAPNQWVGPIITPCRPTVPNTMFVIGQ